MHDTHGMKTLTLSKWILTGLTIAAMGCSGGSKIDRVELVSYSLNDSTWVPDPDMEAIIAPYRASLDSVMNEVLNYSERPLYKGQPESPLGNLMADLCYSKANEYYQPEDGVYAHLCVLNNGGIRSTIPEGEVTLGRVYELMPFENELVVLTLSGKATLDLFGYINASEGVPLANAQLRLTGDGPRDITIGGIPLDTTLTYKVITSDYLANGGDQMSFFANPENYEVVGLKLRDAIIEYFKEEFAAGRSINAFEDGRIYTD